MENTADLCPEDKTVEKMPEIRKPKRIVLIHKTGVMAGIHQIQALETAEGIPNPLPTFVPNIERPLDGDVINASMLKVKRGAIYYSELVVPEGLKRFDGSQR